MMPHSVMMFAAGFGTRMKALTKDRPKPMIPVAGKPLIDHAIELVRGAGLNHIVANLHYKPEILQAHLTPQDVITLTETPDILETGGGLRNALPLLGDDPVFTMNTDTIWAGPNPLQLLAEAWEPAKMDALLMAVPTTQAVGYHGTGDFTRAEDGRLTRGSGVVYGGVQIIKTDLLHDIAERSFSLNLLWDDMLKRGTVYGCTYSGTWCDVGHPAGIALAENMLGYADV